MLILRAFPLSFAILWRFIIVLPFLLIFLAAYVTFTVVWGFFFGLISIFFTILLILALTFVMALIPTMVGTRLGLQAKGETVRGNYGGVFKAALGYGAFEAAARLVLTFGASGLVVLLTPDLTADNFWIVLAGTVEPALNRETSMSGSTIAFLITTLLFAALRAALLPAFAGAAGRGDPGSAFHTPFSGFGSSFIWLFLLIIITYILPFVLIPLGVLGVIEYGLTGPFVDRFLALQPVLMGTQDYAFAMIDLYVIGGIVIFGLWLFSLQCAGAVLAFSKRRVTYQAQKAADQEVERLDPDELRELVRSRMPERKY